MRTLLDELFEMETNTTHACGCKTCQEKSRKKRNGINEELGTSRIIRSLTCKPHELRSVQAVLGRRTTYRELESGLKQRAKIAATWCIKAAQALEKNPRSTTARRIFLQAFRVRPEYAAEWLKKQSWNSRGALVAHRLRRVATMLTDGSIRYFCKGHKAYCPECVDASNPSYNTWTDDFACSSFAKKRVICLGEAFWEQWKGGHVSDNINTLMHEALHIYFGNLIAHGHRGKFSDANCYSLFVLQMNKKPVPARVRARCQATLVR